MKIITQEGFFEQNINKSRFLGFSYYVEKENLFIKIKFSCLFYKNTS